MERRFNLELREARRVIREHNDNPNDFTFVSTPKRRPFGTTRPLGHLFIIKEYTVTVSRGKVPPATYGGGLGKNWVVLFAHDLAMHRFSEGIAGGKHRCVLTGGNSTSVPPRKGSSSCAQVPRSQHLAVLSQLEGRHFF